VEGPTTTNTSSQTSARRIARNFTVRTVGELVAKAASLVFFVDVARELGETGFGDFTLALSLTGTLILASGLGTDGLTAREVARDRSRIHSYLSNVVAVKGLTSALLLLVTFAIGTIEYSGDTRTAIYLVGAGVAIENVGRTWYALFQAYERMEFVSLSLSVQRIITAAAAVTALELGYGLVAVSLIYLAGSGLGLLVAVWSMRRFVVVPRLELDRSRFVPLLRAGLPIGVATLLFTILIRFDAVLLSFLKGGNNRQVGIYGAAFRLVEATMFISWSFGTAALPWLARHGGEAGDAQLVRGYELGLKVITAVLMPMGLVFAVLADDIIDLLYGHQYESSAVPLQLLGALTVLYGINYFTATALTAHDRPGLFSRLFIVVIAVNVVSNLILIPPYGATGAAASAALSGVLLAALGLRQSARAIGTIRVTRAFAGPIAGGAAMTVVLWLARGNLAAAVVLGGATYVAGLAAFERLAFPEDFAFFLTIVRRPRLGAPTPPPASVD